MNSRRELSLGLLAALVSLIIIGGSFITSLAEGKISISQLPQVINNSPIPTMVIFTPRPGEPSLTPSLIPPPTEQDELSTSTRACPVPLGWVEITVNLGDTLESLASIYAVSVETLREENCLLLDNLTPGTFLHVPALPASPSPTQRPLPTSCKPPWGWVQYTIQPGDTLYSLAKAYDISLNKLMEENCLVSTKIFAGDKIWVPNVPTITPVPSSTPTSTPSFTPSVTALQPTITNTLIPTPTFTPTITPSPATNTPTHTPTSTPTNTATSQPTDAPTITLTSAPYP